MNAPKLAPCAKNAPSLKAKNEVNEGGGGVSHRLRAFNSNPRPARISIIKVPNILAHSVPRLNFNRGTE